MSMEGLSRRLAEWRQFHEPPTRIPKELWAMAVELAGVAPTKGRSGKGYDVNGNLSDASMII